MKNTLMAFAVLSLAAGRPALEAASNTLTIKGSDTMVILGQRWAEEYMKKKSGAIVQVTGGGSGTGIAALINGSTDIAQASRPMKDSEKAMVRKQRGKPAHEIAVALDGISVYVHQSCPLREISLDQLKTIFTGEVEDWSDLGLPAGRIIAYGRENNSGTYAYFKEHVLKDEDFGPAVLSLPGTAAVINAVAKDKKALGYGGIAYAKGVRILPVQDKGAAVAPTMQNVVSGSYPISRKLFFYTAGEPEGTAKAFVEWVLSPQGQRICESVGYFPLPGKP